MVKFHPRLLPDQELQPWSHFSNASLHSSRRNEDGQPWARYMSRTSYKEDMSAVTYLQCPAQMRKSHVSLLVMPNHHSIIHIVRDNNPFQGAVIFFPALKEIGNWKCFICTPMVRIILGWLITLGAFHLDVVCDGTWVRETISAQYSSSNTILRALGEHDRPATYLLAYQAVASSHTETLLLRQQHTLATVRSRQAQCFLRSYRKRNTILRWRHCTVWHSSHTLLEYIRLHAHRCMEDDEEDR